MTALASAPRTARMVRQQYSAWLRGKHVIVVGPAGYLKGQGRGEWIESFDVVVKLNWGETLPREDYGRTDVLYKRLLKLGHADDILVQEYVDAGMQWLVGVGTRPDPKSLQYLTNTIGDRIDWYIDETTRASMLREVSGSPLLGMIAVRDLLSHDIASLTVTGCDFYATGYAPEYGGGRYRRFMNRKEGAMGARHDGPSQQIWLAKTARRDPRLKFDAEVAAVLGIQPVKKSKKARLPQPKRFTWTPTNVTTRHLPAMSIRTYIEQKALTNILSPLSLESAAELGAGFGRMTVVLADHAKHVEAFEREPELAEAAARLLPNVTVHNVTSLTAIPSKATFDLVMTFTVLQHMSHEDAAKVLAEAKRLSSRYILVVEDTDPNHAYIDGKNSAHFTLGRSVKEYRRLLAPFELVHVERREAEQTFKYNGVRRPYVGHYMLFEKRAA